MGVVNGRTYRVTQFVDVRKTFIYDSLHRELSFDTPQGLLWDDDNALWRHIKMGVIIS